MIAVGRKAADRPHKIDRRMIASWRIMVPPHLWAALDRDLTGSEAAELRAAIEPVLPSAWRFGARWYHDGSVFAIRRGRKTECRVNIVPGFWAHLNVR
jgi:hypothetical protein